MWPLGRLGRPGGEDACRGRILVLGAEAWLDLVGAGEAVGSRRGRQPAGPRALVPLGGRSPGTGVVDDRPGLAPTGPQCSGRTRRGQTPGRKVVMQAGRPARCAEAGSPSRPRNREGAVDALSDARCCMRPTNQGSSAGSTRLLVKGEDEVALRWCGAESCCFRRPSAMPRKATGVPRGYSCPGTTRERVVGYFGVDGHSSVRALAGGMPSPRPPGDKRFSKRKGIEIRRGREEV